MDTLTFRFRHGMHDAEGRALGWWTGWFVCVFVCVVAVVVVVCCSFMVYLMYIDIYVYIP